MPTSTGSRADHRLPLKPSEIHARRPRLGGGRWRSGCADRSTLAVRPVKIAPIAKDLQAHRGTSLVIAGDGQPAAVHALAHAMNQALGNVGQTVVYTKPVEAEPVDQLQSLRDLVADMNAGKVDLLVIVGGNPVYTAPADLKFADAMGKVKRASISACTTMRRRRCAIGRSRKRTSSKRGATRAPTTARSRSSSR